MQMAHLQKRRQLSQISMQQTPCSGSSARSQQKSDELASGASAPDLHYGSKAFHCRSVSSDAGCQPLQDLQAAALLAVRRGTEFNTKGWKAGPQQQQQRQQQQQGRGSICARAGMLQSSQTSSSRPAFVSYGLSKSSVHGGVVLSKQQHSTTNLQALSSVATDKQVRVTRSSSGSSATSRLSATLARGGTSTRLSATRSSGQTASSPASCSSSKRSSGCGEDAGMPSTPKLAQSISGTQRHCASSRCSDNSNQEFPASSESEPPIAVTAGTPAVPGLAIAAAEGRQASMDVISEGPAHGIHSSQGVPSSTVTAQSKAALQHCQTAVSAEYQERQVLADLLASANAELARQQTEHSREVMELQHRAQLTEEQLREAQQRAAVIETILNLQQAGESSTVQPFEVVTNHLYDGTGCASPISRSHVSKPAAHRALPAEMVKGLMVTNQLYDGTGLLMAQQPTTSCSVDLNARTAVPAGVTGPLLVTNQLFEGHGCVEPFRRSMSEPHIADSHIASCRGPVQAITGWQQPEPQAEAATSDAHAGSHVSSHARYSPAPGTEATEHAQEEGDDAVPQSAPDTPALLPRRSQPLDNVGSKDDDTEDFYRAVEGCAEVITDDLPCVDDCPAVTCRSGNEGLDVLVGDLPADTCRSAANHMEPAAVTCSAAARDPGAVVAEEDVCQQARGLSEDGGVAGVLVKADNAQHTTSTPGTPAFMMWQNRLWQPTATLEWHSTRLHADRPRVSFASGTQLCHQQRNTQQWHRDQQQYHLQQQQQQQASAAPSPESASSKRAVTVPPESIPNTALGSLPASAISTLPSYACGTAVDGAAPGAYEQPSTAPTIKACLLAKQGESGYEQATRVECQATPTAMAKAAAMAAVVEHRRTPTTPSTVALAPAAAAAAATAASHGSGSSLLSTTLLATVSSLGRHAGKTAAQVVVSASADGSSVLPAAAIITSPISNPHSITPKSSHLITSAVTAAAAAVTTATDAAASSNVPNTSAPAVESAVESAPATKSGAAEVDCMRLHVCKQVCPVVARPAPAAATEATSATAVVLGAAGAAAAAPTSTAVVRAATPSTVYTASATTTAAGVDRSVGMVEDEPMTPYASMEVRVIPSASGGFMIMSREVTRGSAYAALSDLRAVRDSLQAVVLAYEAAVARCTAAGSAESTTTDSTGAAAVGMADSGAGTLSAAADAGSRHNTTIRRTSTEVTKGKQKRSQGGEGASLDLVSSMERGWMATAVRERKACQTPNNQKRVLLRGSGGLPAARPAAQAHTDLGNLESAWGDSWFGSRRAAG